MDLELSTMAETRADAARQHSAFSGLNLSHVRGEISEALSHFGRLGVLEEYTKHDMSHIEGMLRMYDWLIPERSAEKMTPADWLLLTLATYLHDFGLLVTRDEYDRRNSTAGFVQFAKKVLENDDPAFQDYRAQLEGMPEHGADSFLYQEFVRANHAQRIRGWLQGSPDPALGVDTRVQGRLMQILEGVDETFRDDLGLICESHHADDLGDLKKYPLSKPYGPSRFEEANLQYVALMLRTADLLHITRDRVPAMAALVVNPRNPKSQVEWAKQTAVKSVRPKPISFDVASSETSRPQDTIEVHATFKESEGYFALTQYLKYANDQVGQSHTWAAVSQATEAPDYQFPWRRIDRSQIKAQGFVAEPFEFTLDQGKILDLLTGHTLYNDSGVVVRELVQNALDAVRLQGVSAGSAYVPKITVRWTTATRTLEVVDNGVGMTQAIIEGNFLRVGSSRYQEPDFRKLFPEFASISRFGIGVLSAFMVADDVAVVTSSPTETQARQISLRDVHGQYLVRLLDKQSTDVPQMIREHGTSVRIKLRPSAQLVDVDRLLRYWLILPGCDVALEIDDQAAVPIGFESMKDALAQSLVASELVRVGVDGLVSHYGEAIEIREVKHEGFDLAFAVTWTRWLEEWEFLRVERDRGDGTQREVIFGTSIGGIRVTESAPGYASGGVAAMANLTGQGAPRTNVARSAIERTDEYDRFLRRVYSAYTEHIGNEMTAFENERGGSATKASQEGSYMLNDLVQRREIDSEELLSVQVRSLPLMVVEEGDLRSRKSLAELDAFDVLWSAEGTAVSSFESVLQSIRGASSVSVRRLVAALGAADALDLPSGPLISGRLSSRLYSSRFFSRFWEPARFETDSEARLLRVAWHKVQNDPRWINVSVPKNLPGNLVQRLEATGFSQRLYREQGILLPSENAQVEVAGFSETIVATQGRFFILPTNPMLKIVATSKSVPEAHRIWAIAWTLESLVIGDSDRRRFAFRGAYDAPRDAGWRASIIDYMRNMRLFEIVDEAATVEALSSDASTDVLDVQRWDRRGPIE